MHTNFTLGYFCAFTGAFVAAKIGSYITVIAATVATLLAFSCIFGISFSYEHARVLSVLPFSTYFALRGIPRIALSALAKCLIKDIHMEINYSTTLVVSTTIASITASILSPVFKEISCLGSDKCYQLLFGVDFIILFIGTVEFLAGANYYRTNLPVENDPAQLSLKFLSFVMEKVKQKLRHSDSDSDEEDFIAVSKSRKSNANKITNTQVTIDRNTDTDSSTIRVSITSTSINRNTDTDTSVNRRTVMPTNIYTRTDTSKNRSTNTDAGMNRSTNTDAGMNRSTNTNTSMNRSTNTDSIIKKNAFTDADVDSDNDEDSEEKIRTSMKNFLDVFPLLIPVPMFWALYDQQVTLFLLQAEVMYHKIFNFYIYPEWILVMQPILSILLQYFHIIVLTRVMDNFKNLRSLVNRVFLGLLLGAISFAIATFLEAQIERSRLDSPTQGILNLFNGSNCTIQLGVYTDVDEVQKTIAPRNYVKLYENRSSLHIIEIEIEAYCANENFTKSFSSNISTRKTLTHMVIMSPGAIDLVGPYEDIKSKHPILAYVRLLYSINNTKTLRLVGPETREIKLNQEGHYYPDFLIKEGLYNITIDEKMLKENVKFGLGGIYSILIQEDDHLEAKVHTLTKANNISIFWLLPQMILLTLSEILISYNGIRYLIFRTSSEMKIIVEAFWFLSVAAGNFIIVLDLIINLCSFRKIYIFLQYTAFMILNSILHLFISTPY
ncbi:hypothetical protein O3M35_002539 [Rhynocoris fuscipes]